MKLRFTHFVNTSFGRAKMEHTKIIFIRSIHVYSYVYIVRVEYYSLSVHLRVYANCRDSALL